MQDQLQRTITVPNARLSLNCYAWQDSFTLSVTNSETRDELRVEGINTPQAFQALAGLVSGLKYHDEQGRARDSQFLDDLETAIKRVREAWPAASENTQST